MQSGNEIWPVYAISQLQNNSFYQKILQKMQPGN